MAHQQRAPLLLHAPATEPSFDQLRYQHLDFEHDDGIYAFTVAFDAKAYAAFFRKNLKNLIVRVRDVVESALAPSFMKRSPFHTAKLRPIDNRSVMAMERKGVLVHVADDGVDASGRLHQSIALFTRVQPVKIDFPGFFYPAMMHAALHIKRHPEWCHLIDEVEVDRTKAPIWDLTCWRHGPTPKHAVVLIA
jgi:hypothetical protein